MGIVEGITAIKAAVELAKVASDLVKRPVIDSGDVQSKLHEMLIHAVNAQIALNEAQIDISDLRQQLQKAKDQRELEVSLVYVHNVYWKKLDPNQLDGPYCPECWHQRERMLTRMRFVGEDEYLNSRDNSAMGTTRKRKYHCLLHGSASTVMNYLVPSDFFVNVAPPWTPDAPQV